MFRNYLVHVRIASSEVDDSVDEDDDKGAIEKSRSSSSGGNSGRG